MFYVRAFLFLAWLVLGSILGLLLVPFRWKDPTLNGTFGKIISWGCAHAVGMKSECEGVEKILANQPCVYVANHQSGLDIATLGRFFPERTVIIGKKEILYIPVFGWLFAAGGNVLLDRQNHRKAVGGLSKAVAAVKEKGFSVWVFPEGTRNLTGRGMLPFKKGAFHLAVQAGVPILPLVSEPLATFYDSKNQRFHGGTVRIKVLDPISTKGLTTDDVPQLTERVHALMLAALKTLERP
ncbi:1-acyl-sn-glycerol-3-phosphate acyltransferase [bacterium]|jgi:1-acyl-sn-glycerol-3-phosphate acyltransferase|nr:1-acyl-sn-glycerol-3-phosphate acyltransferase [bacterium]